jgi:hypothetical protein
MKQTAQTSIDHSRTARYGFGVDLKVQCDNRLPGPTLSFDVQNQNCAGKHFFGLLAATYQEQSGFKVMQNRDSI